MAKFRKYSGLVRFWVIIVIVLLFGIFYSISTYVFSFNKVTFEVRDANSMSSSVISSGKFQPSHVNTPDSVKAVYMTACTASMPSLRTKVLDNLKDTEINAIVIDIKDYTGTISYLQSLYTNVSKSSGCRISDLPTFLAELHGKDIYVIARITVFQDPFYARNHPDLAVRSYSDPDGLWKDKNGLAYIDPSAEPYWDYIVNIAKESYNIGFDEINFDYIRFPSDGVLSDAKYTWSEGMRKNDALRKFFLYLREQLYPLNITMSADLFGLTTTVTDDLGIGQVLEDALPYFDYVSPMVYPSHFASGFNGYASPATRPYDVVFSAMTKAVMRANLASTSPRKLRPWLQDFNLGAKYTPEMVRAQIQATYDSGLNSWMLWNAGSSYQNSALEKKTTSD